MAILYNPVNHSHAFVIQCLYSYECMLRESTPITMMTWCYSMIPLFVWFSLNSNNILTIHGFSCVLCCLLEFINLKYWQIAHVFNNMGGAHSICNGSWWGELQAKALSGTTKKSFLDEDVLMCSLIESNITHDWYRPNKNPKPLKSWNRKLSLT